MTHSTRRLARLMLTVLLLGAGCKTLGESSAAREVGATPTAEGPTHVTALGRLEPKDGIIRIAGPSRPTAVIAKLLVAEGDRVEAGRPLAVLDTRAENEARVARMKAELTNALSDLGRVDELFHKGIAAATLREATQLKVDVARAELQVAQAALDSDTVRAPCGAQVLAIHTRPGERVGPEGIAELAQTDEMYAVAEVYETDVGRVKAGQHATIRSPAVDPPLTGTVERVGMKIGRLDIVDTDPAARTDARVVEVWIKLDDPGRSARLSNLQVAVAIEP